MAHGSDTDTDPLPAFAHVEVGGDGPGSGDDGGAAPHVARAIPFGPWTISQIWSKKQHTGWGANCCRHFSDGPVCLSCKKNIQARKVGGVIVPGALDEAERLCKQWLLLGVTIRVSDPAGRQQHVLDITRDKIPLRSHAELDAEAATMM